MKHLRAAFLAFSCLLASSLAWSGTLVAWPSTTPAATCELCFFPEPPAVFAYDDAGARAVGVPVTFSAATPANAFIPGVGAGPFTVLTDGSGVARMPPPGLVTSAAGAFTLVVTSPAASNAVVFSMQVSGGPPTRLEVASVEPVAAVVGTTYAQHLVARVYGPDGQVLPNAAVQFTAAESGASGTFAGSSRAYARAGPMFGEAYAPDFTANGLVGWGEVVATTFNAAANAVSYRFFNSVAGAASVQPVPGSTPQSTRVTAYYPEWTSAIVRDAAGNPLKDAAVTFSIVWRETGGFGFFMSEPATSMYYVAVTGEDGIAVPPARLMAVAPGKVDLSATATGVATPATYDLTSLPGGVKSFEVVSGNNQSAFVNTTYPQRWAVRALGADGLPVPYAHAYFYADPRPEMPSGLFDGRQHLYVMADGNGVATAPPFTANGVVGSNFGSIFGFGEGTDPGAFTMFGYTNLSDALTATQWSVEDSVAVGASTYFAPSVNVFNAAGSPQPGVHFTFTADSACGTFTEGYVFEGTTDADGRATASLFRGVAPAMSCPIRFAADGLATPLNLPMHVFAPASVVLTTPQPTIDVVAGQRFPLTVFAQADGLPVNITGIALAIGTSTSGATAVLDAYAIYQLNSGRYGAAFLANDRPGSYEIRASYGGGSVGVIVKQRPR